MTQEHKAWPAITLNFSQDGLPGQIKNLGATPYYKTMLTIHVLTQHYDDRPTTYINGALIAKGIGQRIMDTVATWTTPITGDIRIFNPDRDIKAFESRGELSDFSSIFDYVLSIDLHHA